MSLAPYVLASLEGDVNHCCVGWRVWTCVDLQRGFFVVFLSFALIRSVCKEEETNPPRCSLRGRGLCPPAFSDPWLISGAPWRDNCEPKPLWKNIKYKKKHPEGTKHLWRSELFANKKKKERKKKRVRPLAWAPMLWSTWSSARESWQNKSCVKVRFSSPTT